MKTVPGTSQYAIEAYQREMDRALAEWLRTQMKDAECNDA
jgi:hypothetical protein